MPSSGSPPSTAALALLRSPQHNKSTAFTPEERARYGLRGLLPPAHESMETQLARVMLNLNAKSSDLERYVYLMNLMDYSERLFYRTIAADVDRMLPLIYTPTVGKACLEFSTLLPHPRGLYVTIDDLGKVTSVIANWPSDNVRAVVVTDGERILGLGDLGANGMGIPLGKAALYSACAGIDPTMMLPVTLDVGTNNEKLLSDPLYIGLRRRRVRGEQYDALVHEFIAAVRDRYGANTLIQFEDFGNSNAFRLLDKYINACCCFNDDIQGTASVSVSALLTSIAVTGKPFDQNTFLFLGAGMAATGIAQLMVDALVDHGMTRDDAMRRMYFVDSTGLLVRNRPEREPLAAHKVPFAHEGVPFVKTLAEAVDLVRPTCLIGVSAQGGAFDERILRRMAELNERPVILALSNPTDKAECTAEQAYRCTGGRAVFASGSPFNPVTLEDGRTLVPGQCNNAFIFPGVALGILVTQARTVPPRTFLVAAEALSKEAPASSLAQGNLFPPLASIRDVSARIAVAVAQFLYDCGVADARKPADLLATVQAFQYNVHSYDSASATPRL